MNHKNHMNPLNPLVPHPTSAPATMSQTELIFQRASTNSAAAALRIGIGLVSVALYFRRRYFQPAMGLE